MPLAHGQRIDALHAKRREQRAHRPVEFGGAEMPELDRQRAAEPAQLLHADPRAGEILHAPAANHETAPGEMVRARRNAFNEAGRAHHRVVDVNKLFRDCGHARVHRAEAFQLGIHGGDGDAPEAVPGLDDGVRHFGQAHGRVPPVVEALQQIGKLRQQRQHARLILPVVPGERAAPPHGLEKFPRARRVAHEHRAGVPVRGRTVQPRSRMHGEGERAAGPERGAEILLGAHDERVGVEPDHGLEPGLERAVHERDFVPVRGALELHFAQHGPVGDAVPRAAGGVVPGGQFQQRPGATGGLLDENGARHVRRRGTGAGLILRRPVAPRRRRRPRSRGRSTCGRPPSARG